MKFLLDTHVLLWSLMDDSSIPKGIKQKICDGNNIVFVSAVSSWEIIIKKSIGKLTVPDNLEEVIIKTNFIPLPIQISHTIAVLELPLIHADPFDRLLIAQCKVEGLTLITQDKNIMKYEGISILWE